jgi:hypothetical protein
MHHCQAVGAQRLARMVWRFVGQCPRAKNEGCGILLVGGKLLKNKGNDDSTLRRTDGPVAKVVQTGESSHKSNQSIASTPLFTLERVRRSNSGWSRGPSLPAFVRRVPMHIRGDVLMLQRTLTLIALIAAVVFTRTTLSGGCGFRKL